jgi:WD40 repeat protein
MKDGVRVFPQFNLSEVPRLLRDHDPWRTYKSISVAFSPDGATLATGDAYGEVRVWDLATQREMLVLPDHTFDINDLVFSPNGTTLYAASYERVVRVWDARSGDPQASLDLDDGITPDRLALHPEGSPLLATSVSSARLYVWDTRTGELLTTKPAAKNAIGLSLSADGEWVAYPDERTVYLWELDDLLSPGGEPQAAFGELDGEIWEIALSPDAALLAVALSHGAVQILDTATGERIAALQVTASFVRGVDFSPDGKFLLVSSGDGWWSIWGVE